VWKRISTASTVVYCRTCHAPVVDSPKARAQHEASRGHQL
jgi:hypothetical protein